MSVGLALKRLYGWKVRGIRWVEIFGLMVVAAMIFSVYLAKAAAAREGAEIADLERQITQNGHRVRLLRAEVARLERPARLEVLSRGVGLGPVDVHRVATADALPGLAPESEPAPVVVAAPSSSPSVEAAPSIEAAVPVEVAQ